MVKANEYFLTNGKFAYVFTSLYAAFFVHFSFEIPPVSRPLNCTAERYLFVMLIEMQT